MSVTFAELFDALTAAGLAVGVAERDGRHAITVTDKGGERSIALTVRGGFDRTADLLVASMRLREGLATAGRMPDLRARDRVCCGRWPEFLQVWPLRSR